MAIQSKTVLIGILLGVLLSSNDGAGQTPAVDLVPRDRLVTDAELFAFFDRAVLQKPAIRQALQAGDTTEALRHLATYLKRRTTVRYFFEPQQVQRRMVDFARRYPDFARRTRARADAFMRVYGADVDWRRPGRDRLGRPHTPNTIRYLARQARAADLAMSYYLSGEERRYLDFFLQQVRDFVADYEAGKTEAGRNDVFERFYAGHRTRNWLFAHHLLLGSPGYRWQDQVFMLKVFLLHGARLIDSCKKFHWGNHQLHGLAGLFEMSALHMEMPVMRQWNEQAHEVIVQHITREIKPDGFQFERASHYFKLDILNYFRIGRIAELNGIELPALFHQRFRKMFDAIVALAMPNKKLPVLQDAQATYRAFRPGSGEQVASHDVAELPEPDEALFMSLGAALFESPEYKYFGAQKFPARLYWFMPEKALHRYAALNSETPKLGSVALDSSGYFVMRSGWAADDLYLIIDGGLAQHKPDHIHGGVLGVIAYGFGEVLLPNYRVRYSDPSYRTMKNSLVKNVALADDILQGQGWISNHARTGFGIWEKLPQPQVHAWIAGDHFDYFSGSHNAFEANGVTYRRSIVFFKPHAWIVVDAFASEGLHQYQQIWQGDYSEIDDQYNRARLQGKTGQLFILQADPARMEIRKQRNFWTHSIQFEKRGVRSYTFLTALYPLPASSEIEPDIRLFGRSNYRQVRVSAGSHTFSLYFKKQANLALDEITTDAEIVAVHYEADTLRAVLMLNGSRLSLREFTIVADRVCTVELARDASGRWKWTALEGKPQKVDLKQER